MELGLDLPLELPEQRRVLPCMWALTLARNNGLGPSVSEDWRTPAALPWGKPGAARRVTFAVRGGLWVEGN